MKKYLVDFIFEGTHDFLFIAKTKNINAFIEKMCLSLRNIGVIRNVHYEKLPIKCKLKKEDWKAIL